MQSLIPLMIFVFSFTSPINQIDFLFFYHQWLYIKTSIFYIYSFFWFSIKEVEQVTVFKFYWEGRLHDMELWWFKITRCFTPSTIFVSLPIMLLLIRSSPSKVWVTPPSKVVGVCLFFVCVHDHTIVDTMLML